MKDHKCLYEYRWGVIETELKTIKDQTEKLQVQVSILHTKIDELIGKPMTLFRISAWLLLLAFIILGTDIL